MSEPREPKKLIRPAEWQDFLQEFTNRNKDRRARFDVFRRDGRVEEEGAEAHLENARLIADGDAKNVEITRIDKTEKDAEKTVDVITNVRGIAVQYDIDGSEDALEITDDQNSLISLRMESKFDGAS